MEKSSKQEQHLKKRPSAILSLMPIVMLVAMLTCTIRSFGSNALDGASQITLLAVSALCVLIGMGWLNVPWASFEKAIVKNVSSVASALVILLLIGALGGAWMVSGVVPSLIYYGLHIIHPGVFLASSCLICALVSVMTGSSWTTIATIGIALMGIGRAQGFDDGWIAGAIISGAYFGDKISPLSETTTLASAWRTAVLAHTLYAHNHRAFYHYSAHHLCRGWILLLYKQFARHCHLCIVTWHTLQHHTVATACTRAHRTDDSTQDTACHHPVPIHFACRDIRLGVPDRCYARDRPFIIQGCYEERIWQHSSTLR